MTVHPYPRLARRALEIHLSGAEPTDGLLAEVADAKELWVGRYGCFVSIKTKNDDLRGCIGTIAPVQDNLGREIMVNAVSAGTRDPRFRPISKPELAEVAFSVDVLSPLEAVRSLDDLDPSVYGVIVEKGGRRGLLLPDLEGVDTVIQQVSIAARKAGLGDLDGINLKRFTVARYAEKES